MNSGFQTTLNIVKSLSKVIYNSYRIKIYIKISFSVIIESNQTGVTSLIIHMVPGKL